MTREELEHAIRAACDVAEDTEVYVFGSQAILGQYPEAPAELRQSAEADVVPKNSPDRSDVIDGALGELSQFHATYKYYVQGVSLTTAKLPDGWEVRCIQVRNANTNNCTGWCLEAHDLALAKLAAFRDKDRDFVRVLLRESMVQWSELLERLPTLPVELELRERVELWIRETAADLGVG